MGKLKHKLMAIQSVRVNRSLNSGYLRVSSILPSPPSLVVQAPITSNLQDYSGLLAFFLPIPGPAAK